MIGHAERVGNRMVAAVRAYRLEVFDYFFRLTRESVRLFSNSGRKHCLLDEVMEERAPRAPRLIESYEVEHLKGHLRTIPVHGDIGFILTLSEASAGTINSALPALQDILGASIRAVEAFSLVLFDLVVERNATEIMTKLGMTSVEAKAYRPRLKRRAANVVPIT